MKIANGQVLIVMILIVSQYTIVRRKIEIFISRFDVEIFGDGEKHMIFLIVWYLSVKWDNEMLELIVWRLSPILYIIYVEFRLIECEYVGCVVVVMCISLHLLIISI